MNNAESVKEFTEGSSGKSCPDFPVVMSKDSVLFIIRMVISELDELACTVSSSREDKDNLMKIAFDSRDECKNYYYPTALSKVSAQADSMVDAWYYMLNIAAKHGLNLSKLFNIVHEANMAKRDPKTKKFIRRESDGKVIKPDGWLPPDIEGEMQKQFERGSWTNT